MGFPPPPSPPPTKLAGLLSGLGTPHAPPNLGTWELTRAMFVETVSD